MKIANLPCAARRRNGDVDVGGLWSYVRGSRWRAKDPVACDCDDRCAKAPRSEPPAGPAH